MAGREREGEGSIEELVFEAERVAGVECLLCWATESHPAGGGSPSRAGGLLLLVIQSELPPLRD